MEELIITIGIFGWFNWHILELNWWTKIAQLQPLGTKNTIKPKIAIDTDLYLLIDRTCYTLIFTQSYGAHDLL